jgi:EAL domain-containing protein (putative c-di-GMP-specific phosphodiesterase class I)
LAEPALIMSVNSSIRHLANPRMVSDLESVLARTPLVPGSLWLEMSEGAIVSLGDAACRRLRRLKSMQIGIEIDDFGTSPNSAAYLRRIPFDTLKIDGSFVRELGTETDSSEIIDSILTFVGALGKAVAAEGVETREQFQRLMHLGCPCGQGFYFSRPVTASAAAELLRGAVSSRERSHSQIHLV